MKTFKIASRVGDRDKVANPMSDRVQGVLEIVYEQDEIVYSAGNE